MIVQLKAVFSGKVQGVFFRAFTKKYADKLGIKGYAKNLKDGSVEVIAVGEKDSLDSLLSMLHEKPGYGNIEKEHVNFSDVEENYTGFLVL